LLALPWEPRAARNGLGEEIGDAWGIDTGVEKCQVYRLRQAQAEFIALAPRLLWALERLVNEREDADAPSVYLARDVLREVYALR
jgi:hypothetical protein